MARGLFDADLNKAGLFDPQAQRGGVFDPDLEVSASGPDVTVGLTGVAATGVIGAFAVALIIGLTGATAAAATTGVAAPQTAVTLAGQSSTGSIGSFTVSNTRALTGNNGTGSIGALTASPSLALVGVSSAGSIGNFVPATTLGLAGVTATGSIGTLTAQVAGDVTVALTGVSGTGSIGTLSPSTSVSLVGVSAAGSIGSFAPSTSRTLTGVAATSSLGTLSPATTVTLVGVSGTGSIGTLGASISGNVTVALTGVSGTGSIGVLSPTLSVALVGVSGTAVVRTLVSGTSSTLVGVSSTGSTGIFGSTRNVALTGSGGVATIGALAAAPSFTLTGVAASITTGSLSVSSVVALTGVNASTATGLLVGVGPTVPSSDIIILAARSSRLIALIGSSSRIVAMAGRAQSPISLTAVSMTTHPVIAYRAALIALGAYAHWDLDDSGPTFTEDIRAADAVSTGSGVIPQQSGPIAGTQAVGFDGTIGSRLEVPNGLLSLRGDSAFSQDCWFWLDTPPDPTLDSLQVLWFWRAAGASNRTVWLNYLSANSSPTGAPMWFLEAQAVVTPVSSLVPAYTGTLDLDTGLPTYTFVAGRYYHVAQTWSDRRLRLYLNGVLHQEVTLDPGSYILNGYNAQLVFGNLAFLQPVTDASYNSPLIGRVAQVTIYKAKELTATEVAQIYTLGTAAMATEITLSGTSRSRISLTGSTS